MLSEFKSFGKEKGYFEIKKIRDFDKDSAEERESIAHINTEAIDFDKTARFLAKRHRQNPFSSCDAVDIVESENQINLIEIKRFYEKVYPRDIETLPKKIDDSRSILQNILRDKRFHHPDRMQKFKSCRKNIIFAFGWETEPDEDVVIMRLFNMVKEDVSKLVEQNRKEGENFRDLFCIELKDFDAEYQKVIRPEAALG